MTSITSKNIIADARASFDYYLTATQLFRRIEPLPDGTFLYPEDTIQSDAGAFGGFFTCIWRAIGLNQTFDRYYKEKKIAFEELARIVTPNEPDPHGFTSHARFWKYDEKVPVTDSTSVRNLCRTLRNGLAHFNFRYIDVTPSEYFHRMGLSLPPHLPQPDVACHYRIFICDWKNRRDFMAPDSDTRIIETHFAHFRYHLFMFLARFFSDPEHEVYKDILTLQPIK